MTPWSFVGPGPVAGVAWIGLIGLIGLAGSVACGSEGKAEGQTGLASGGGRDALPVWETLDTVPFRGKQDDLALIDADHAWYGNGEGKVYRTADGGATWEKVWDQPGTFVRTLAFVDETTGFLGNVGTGYFPNVSDETLVYRTRDGGETWEPLPHAQVPGMGGLCGMQVLRAKYINHGVLEDKTRVIGAGRVGGPAWLIMSDDLGETWTHRDLSEHAGMAFDVHFFDLNTGVVAASGSGDVAEGTARVLRTEDGGRTWSVVYDSGRGYENIWKLFFVTPEIGYGTVQSYDPGATQRYVIKTVDGGKTWEELPLVNDARVREFGIGFIDAQRGWVGAVPHAFQTEDGGHTWTPAEMGVAVNKVRVVHEDDGAVTAYAIGVQVHKAVIPARDDADNADDAGE